MSNFAVQELMYLSQAPGAAKNTFTTEVSINDAVTMGVLPIIPANFWRADNAQAGRAIQLKALVSLGSTGTPTFTPVIRLGATAGSTTGPVVGGVVGSTLTTVSGAASVIEMDLIISMVTRLQSGANSTLRGVGVIKSAGFAVPSIMLWGGSASPGTVGSFDPSVDNFVSLNFACGTSNAANQVQCQRLEMHGLN